MIKKEIRATLYLGLPLIFAQLAQMSMSLIDTLMVGRLGSLDLAGVALGGAVFYPVTIVCVGILLAVSPLVTYAFGSGDFARAGRAARQGLWLAAVLAVPAILMLWHAAVFLDWLGHPAELVDRSRDYLRAVVWGVPGFFAFVVLRQLVEGVSRPRVVLVITLLAVGLNIAGNYVLMFGRLGFPPLGLVGCGWATTLVFWFMAGSLVFILVAAPELREFPVFSRFGTPDLRLIFEIIKIGWPLGIMQFLEVSLFAASGMMMGLIGTASLAAHQIALTCAAYVFMMPLGLSFATAVRVGQSAGRGDAAAARRAGLTGIGMGACLMTASAVGFWLMPGALVSLFLDTARAENREVVSLAASLLTVAAVFQIFDGIQVAAVGALRGVKVTRDPMLIALFSYWICGFSTAYWLGFRARWGGEGIWWGLVLGLAVAAVLLSWRFWKASSELVASGPQRSQSSH